MGIYSNMAVIASRSTAPRRRYLAGLFGLVLLLSLSALVAGFVVWPRSPINLARTDQAGTAELYRRWQAGDVVVLVRHAERCDRSGNACMGPADGITVAGRETAVDVGAALTAMGMHSSDVASSPLTRTVQTAHAMFGQPAREQNWLVDCDADMIGDIKAHKVAGRNLVLVTHNGCISRFERDMGFPHARDTEYTSSLFVALGADHQLKVLGVVGARDWPQVIALNAGL